MIRRDFSVCPTCGGKTVRCTSFLNTPSEFWFECTRCNTFINTYIPMEHQEAIHRDSHRFILSAGGYGTGKTTCTRQEVYKHIFLTPNANILIGANVASQYEQTLKRELESDIPKQFVKYYNQTKQYMDLFNGARIIYRPFDDPNKLRSYNISMFVILEGSECKFTSFEQLQTRLRNMAATKQKLDEKGEPVFEIQSNGTAIPVIEHDWRRGIIETNPSPGWVREFLLKSDKISKYGPVMDSYQQHATVDSYSTHIAASEVNKFLPPDYIPNLLQSKPEYWCRKYLYGSFTYSEGLVYPGIANAVIDDFDIPHHWRRIVAFDYGLADPSVFLFGAIDEENCNLIIYKEYRTNNKNVEELSMDFRRESGDIPPGCWVGPPIIDPKSAPMRDYNKKSLADYFADYGIYFKPGVINKDARIFRTNTYLESGVLKIFGSCKALIHEMENYKYKTDPANNDLYINKPEDKNDHSIATLEWICCDLPSDPSNLVYGAYNRNGDELSGMPRPHKPLSYGEWVFKEDMDYEPQPDTAFNMIDMWR